MNCPYDVSQVCTSPLSLECEKRHELVSYIPVEASYLFGTFLVRIGLDVTAEGSGKPGDKLGDEGPTRDCWPGGDDICCHGIPRKCFIFGGLPRPLFVGAGGNGVDWRKSGWSADDSAEE